MIRDTYWYNLKIINQFYQADRFQKEVENRKLKIDKNFECRLTSTHTYRPCDGESLQRLYFKKGVLGGFQKVPGMFVNLYGISGYQFTDGSLTGWSWN
jgi:hypothetical protein